MVRTCGIWKFCNAERQVTEDAARRIDRIIPSDIEREPRTDIREKKAGMPILRLENDPYATRASQKARQPAGKTKTGNHDCALGLKSSYWFHQQTNPQGQRVPLRLKDKRDDALSGGGNRKSVGHVTGDRNRTESNAIAGEIGYNLIAGGENT